MAYVPIEKSLPQKRRERFLALTSAKIVITDNPKLYGDAFACISKEACIKGSEAFEFKKPDYKPNDLAYVIFTSGSTGEPKGVEVTTGALHTFGADVKSPISGIETDVVAQVATLAFDASVYEIFTDVYKRQDNGLELAGHFHFNYGSTMEKATNRSGIPSMVDDDITEEEKLQTLCGFFLGSKNEE